MVGQSIILLPQLAAPLSPRLLSAGFSTLPPISSALASGKHDGPKKLSPMNQNSRSSRSPSPTLKRWHTSDTTLSEQTQKHLQLLRVKLSESQVEAETLRLERDELARKLEKSKIKLNKEKKISASFQTRINGLEDELKTLKEQLDCQAFIRNHLELEHKRSIELTNARHHFEMKNLEESYQHEIVSLKDELEETVLKAAVDLNRQHRQLSSEQLKFLRGRRRATYGGMPLVDFNIQPKEVEPETTSSSSRALHTSESVPKFMGQSSSRCDDTRPQ
jgi:hypothetical protein